ncbi:hypothetical protein [Salibacterium lacus]|uniref:Ead/Ea22-like family protein n=1 Tax=Salibacterium lacus TaxID=1898109 RepID=A0ABW5SYV3_9BACI
MSEKVTQDELEAIRKRAEAATGGDWYAGGFSLPTDDQYNVTAYDSGNNPQEIFTAWQGARYPDMAETSQEQARNNAIFCATARTDIPRLLAEVERLQRSRAEIYAEAYAQGYFDQRMDSENWADNGGQDSQDTALANSFGIGAKEDD